MRNVKTNFQVMNINKTIIQIQREDKYEHLMNIKCEDCVETILLIGNWSLVFIVFYIYGL